MILKMHYKFALVVMLLSLQACSATRQTVRHEQLPFTLQNVREDVRVSFPAVEQLSTAALASRLANHESLVLLDIREPQEYSVSHLPGAIRVEPEANERSITAASDLSNKTVVFYCSVGVRSSKLAQKLQAELLRQGAIAVFNLDGGIFAWHNEGRPLQDSSGATDFVHPFDQKYGSLLRRQSLVRFQTR